MPFLNINGVKTHYQDLNGSGKECVMMCHGLLGNLSQFYFSIAPGISKQYRTILYDFKGHGKTDIVPSGYDVDSLVEDMAAILDQLGIEKVHLIGFSYGGLMIMKFALKYPHRVGKLVVIECPNPIHPSADTVKKYRNIGLEGLKEMLPKNVQKGFFANKRQLAKTLKMLAKLFGKTSLIKDMDAEKDLKNEELAKIDHDLLLLYGTESDCLDMAERVASNATNAKLELKTGGHWFLMDYAEEIANELSEYFSVQKLESSKA